MIVMWARMWLTGREYQAIFFADVTNWTSILQNQAPVVVLVVLAFAAGNKKIWRYGHQYDETVARLEAEIARITKDSLESKTERDTRIEQVRKDTEVEIARLKEERERERTRAERYEAMVMRSVESNREIVELVSEAMKRVRA